MGAERIIFKEESDRIMGACFEVYKDKGSGFLEAVYQGCLRIELSLQGIPLPGEAEDAARIQGNIAGAGI